MILIIAAIKPFKLDEVRTALTGLGVRGMMVSGIKGFGAQSGKIGDGKIFILDLASAVRVRTGETGEDAL